MINVFENNVKNKYVKNLKFNGKVDIKNWLSYLELLKGVRIDFEMGNIVNKKRGIEKKDFLYLFLNEK